MALEPVISRELQVTLRRSCRTTLIGNIAEVAVGNAHVRIAVAGNIERIEGIEAEAQRVLAPHVKILEHRHVGVEISGPAQVAVSRRSEGIGRRHAKGANAIV